MAVTRPKPSFLALFTAATAATALVVACDPNQAPSPGAIMLAVNTDMSAPKDVSSVGLYISSDGRPIFSDSRDVAPNGEVKFPATIAIVSDEKRPQAVVRIRAVAFGKDGKVRVLRDALTTVPQLRTALLRMPLTWINEGSGAGDRTQATNSLEGLMVLKSKCTNPEETVIDGRCADYKVDSTALPDFQPQVVFGGGLADGVGGSCFDVGACFAAARPVAVSSGCVGTLPAGMSANDPNLSLAVGFRGGDNATGECLSNGVCYVPLDKGTGWTENGATLKFPPAICDRLAAREAVGIAATTACASKTVSTPACGPASSVPSTNPVAPSTPAAPAPIDFGGTLDLDAGAPDGSQDPDGSVVVPEGGVLPDAGDELVDGDGKPDAVPVDAADADATLESGTGDGGVADASGPPDGAIMDAGVQPFGPVVDYPIGEPLPSNFRFDGTSLFIARARTTGLEPNVMSIDLATLLANPANPAVQRTFYFPSAIMTGNVAPIWDFARSGPFPIGLAAGYQTDGGTAYSNCEFSAPDGGAPCATGGVLPGPYPAGSVVDVAFANTRFYVITNNAEPTVSYFNGSWTNLPISGAQGSPTALHYVPGEPGTIVVGFGNGDIYRCQEPCSGAGAFMAGVPTGGPVVGIEDDGLGKIVWATSGQGIFKENGAAPLMLSQGAGAFTTSLVVDGTFLYAPIGNAVVAYPLDGSDTLGLLVANNGNQVLGLTGTPEHLFFSAPPSQAPTSIKSVCKRFLNVACK